MKKIFGFVVIAVLVLVGCDEPTNNEPPVFEQPTMVTIANNSSVDFFSVSWNGAKMYQIDKGGSKSWPASPGSGYVFFEVRLDQFKMDTISARTQEVFIIGAGENKTFTFLDSTIVVDNDNNTSTLQAFVAQN